MAEVAARIWFEYDEQADDAAREAERDRIVSGLRRHLRARNASSRVGEEILFGDGANEARYLVYSEKPLRLIHLDDGRAASGEELANFKLPDLVKALPLNQGAH